MIINILSTLSYYEIQTTILYIIVMLFTAVIVARVLILFDTCYLFMISFKSLILILVSIKVTPVGNFTA